MAHVRRGRAELFDELGESFIAGLVAELIDAIGVATRAQSVVLDGYLTSQATQDASSISFGLEAPSSGEMATQLLIGQRRRLASDNAVVPFVPNTPLAFVAVDVLAIGAWLLLGLYFAMSKLVPILVLVWASLLPYFQLPSREAIGSLSLLHFSDLPWDLVLESLATALIPAR